MPLIKPISSFRKHHAETAGFKVPAVDCVEEAKAASKKDSCAVLRRIAKASVRDADDPLFNALAGCGLAMPFDRVDIQLDQDFSYPCFVPGKMLETVANAGFFSRVLGVPIAYSDSALTDFWGTYQQIFPEHEVFQQQVPVDFSHLLPFYLHGDGGRTYRKDSIMILSMMSVFGEGTSRNPVDLEPVPGLGRKRSLESGCTAFRPGVNLKGNPLTNRFLFTAMKTELYKKKRGRLTALLDAWGQHLGALFHEGFSFNGEVWKVAILGLTGDAPFLREAGNHVRSFSNVRKSASSKAFLKGVCYLCTAGRTDGPAFEDIRITRAEWTTTCGRMNPLPWEEPSPLLRYLPINDANVASFFKPDLFHIFHAGLGKDFTASALVYMCKSLYKQRRLELALGPLNIEFKQFLREEKEKVNFSCLTFEMLGYASSKSFPKGHWSKNMDTAVVSKFIEHACATHVFAFPDDPCIPLIIDACAAIHQFMTVVFSGSFYLTETEAWQMCSSGHAFLVNYVKLATLSFKLGLCLFALKPVMHMFAHILHTAMLQYDLCPTGVINPVAESTFMSEDFIGRIARISRRVSAKQHGLKIMFRYMVSVKHFMQQTKI